MIRTVEISSVIPASAEQLWTELGSPRAIAAETGGWLRRTTPPGLRSQTLHTACVGRDLGASWILFGSILPVAREHTLITSRLAGERVELSSTSWATASWRHERQLVTLDGQRSWHALSPRSEAEGAGTGQTVLRDRVFFEVSERLARLPGGEALLIRMVERAFRRRHRRLAARVRASADPAVPEAADVEILALGTYFVRGPGSGLAAGRPTAA